jgi:hypothetical protein
MEIYIAEMEEININSTKYQDPVFIGIDTPGSREFGISILDTRDLRPFLVVSGVRSGSLVPTFNYKLQMYERTVFKSLF